MIWIGRTFDSSSCRASGLGLATVQALLEAGAFVSVLDIKDNADLRANGDRVKFFKTDITSDSDVDNVVKGTAAWTESTGAPLGGVVAAAGISTPARVLDDQGNPNPLDVWNRVIAVNLTGSFNLVRHASKYLAKVQPEGPDGERGSIVLVSSVAAVSSIGTSVRPRVRKHSV